MPQAAGTVPLPACCAISPTTSVPVLRDSQPWRADDETSDLTLRPSRPFDEGGPESLLLFGRKSSNALD
jgi:hypothetical protein